MRVFIEKKTMQLNGKIAISGIAAVLFLLLLLALTSVNAYQVGETFRDCAMCPEMVVLPAGKFTMGSPEGERGRNDGEGLQRRVTIPKPFAVGKYNVTVEQYAEFVKETKHKTENCYHTEDQSWDDPGFDQTNNHPVVCVSWEDASTYVDWLSEKTKHEYRLLTEAEWEYAAQAETTTAYHLERMIFPNQVQYPSSVEERGQFSHRSYIRMQQLSFSYQRTAAVGGSPANSFGLHDMHGDVWEWVDDCWHDDYTGTPTNRSTWLSGCRKGNEDDCEGYGDWCKELIVGKEFRVSRGGGRNSSSQQVTSPDRIRTVQTVEFVNVGGFRVARTLNP